MVCAVLPCWAMWRRAGYTCAPIIKVFYLHDRALFWHGSEQLG